MAKQDFETNGMHNGKPIYCPVNGWDCPYYGDGICHINDPVEDCTDFTFFFESWEEWEECDGDEEALENDEDEW